MPTESRPIVRKRRCGLRDVYIAKLTQNDNAGYEAEAPVKFARAITAKIADKYTIEKIYSDDGTEESVTHYEGTDVELEVNALAPQDRSAVFGQLYEGGYLCKNKNDQPPEIALGFRSKRTNGKYEFYWYYAGKFGQGFEEDFETESDSFKTQTNSLKGSFYERAKDGDISLSVDESNLISADTDAAAAIARWFSQVQEKPAPAQQTV